MPGALRILGYGLIGLGAIVLAIYLSSFFPPLEFIWTSIMAIPFPIRFSLGAATTGAVMVFASLIVERIQDRETDRKLKDDT